MKSFYSEEAPGNRIAPTPRNLTGAYVPHFQAVSRLKSVPLKWHYLALPPARNAYR